MGTTIWSVIGMLAAVVVILALAYWCTKIIASRGMSMSTQNIRPGSEMYVLGQLNLGRGERLVLIKLHERCMLLGVTEKSVNVLTELTDEEAEAWQIENDQTDRPPTFFEALKSNLPKKK